MDLEMANKLEAIHRELMDKMNSLEPAITGRWEEAYRVMADAYAAVLHQAEVKALGIRG